MNTTTHVLSPLCNLLPELNRGVTIRTHKYPEGRKVTVRLAILVGDMVANHQEGSRLYFSFWYILLWVVYMQT